MVMMSGLKAASRSSSPCRAAGSKFSGNLPRCTVPSTCARAPDISRSRRLKLTCAGACAACANATARRRCAALFDDHPRPPGHRGDQRLQACHDDTRQSGQRHRRLCRVVGQAQAEGGGCGHRGQGGDEGLCNGTHGCAQVGAALWVTQCRRPWPAQRAADDGLTLRRDELLIPPGGRALSDPQAT